MLVVTSNWAIADGTLHGGPPRDHVDEFFLGVRRRCLRAGFQRDGTYRPISRIDVVLAGDTCDWLVSARWTDGHRPWHGGRVAAGIAECVASAALRRAGRLLAGLRRLARSGVSVPAADPRGRPLLGSLHRVPVIVTLLAGDRDRSIERRSQSSVRAGRGISFGSAWSNGIVAVRHGDDLDPLCGSPCRTADEVTVGVEPAGGVPPGDEPLPSLAESIAVELLSRFGTMIDRHATLRPLVSLLTRRLATGRPIDMADHLAIAIASAALTPGQRRAVVTAWRQAVASWHREARRMNADGGTGFDCIDLLAGWLDGVERVGHGRDPAGFTGGTVGPVGLPLGTGRGASAPPLLLLGHPSADQSPGSAACICLGPAAIRDFSAPPLGRGRGVDVAWVDAGRMSARRRIRAAVPAVVAVFEEKTDREAGGIDTSRRRGDDDGDSVGGRHVRLESLSIGLGGNAEWIATGPESAGHTPGDDSRHPRIIDAA